LGAQLLETSFAQLVVFRKIGIAAQRI